MAPARRKILDDRHLAREASRMDDAFGLYLMGDDAGESEEERSAFRRVCLAHQAEREIVLDDLRDHTRRHNVAWHSWYREHCTPPAQAPAGTVAYVVMDKETGALATPEDLADDLKVCDADAGSPPSRIYAKTPIEQMAQERRDACERAQ
jgi:hypothetical protein